MREVISKGCAKALRGFLMWKTRSLIEFFSWTSLRYSEAINLKWSDIEWDKGFFVYKLKGGRQETYPIDDDIRRVLKEHRVRYGKWLKSLAKTRKKNKNQEVAVSDYVFPGRTGGKWWHAYESIKAAGAAVGIDIHPHKIRHSVAQWFMDGGGEVEGLQLIMGHRSIKTTQGYYQRNLKLKQRARKSINFNLGD